MLTELRIRNFAVIEEAALCFGPGLNVLSGETGAGKTIIMTALGLLLGGRASPDLVRSGAKEAAIEGIFELEGEGPGVDAAEWLSEENPRELVLRRVIAEGGRARVTINDNLATVQTLGRIGAAIVQVYGQHEQQSLLQRDSHLAILDRHTGLEEELKNYRAIYERVQTLRRELDELGRRERERADLLEIGRFRINELERAKLTAGEDDQLAAERVILANAARLTEATHAVEQSLYTGEFAALDAIARAEARLADAAALDMRLKEPLAMVTSARVNLEEAAHIIRAYTANTEVDPDRLEQVESRVNELARLKRKYGGSIDAALSALEQTRREIRELEAISESRAAIESELQVQLTNLAAHARRLSLARSRSGADLAKRMDAELRTLGMRSAVFEARLVPEAAQDGALIHDGLVLGPAGSDAVDFYFSANAGQPALPLGRIVSGGELSRVMLALKRLEAQHRGVATMIFDEVDAGIGGAVAEIVGRKLKQLARFHQILCVTHLAQIAAFADCHFVIDKQERRGTTRSQVAELAPDHRASELARMLGGDETNSKFIRAARELIDRAGA